MKVILIPGHGGKAPKGEYQDFGAVSKDETVDEFHYYQDLIKKFIIPELEKEKIEYAYVERKTKKIMPYAEINAVAEDGDFAIEFHYNSFNIDSAQGSEYLYYPTSKGGLKLATILRDNISEIMGFALRTNDKSKQGLRPTSTGNGSPVLKKTKCVTVLIEPFFITNPVEFEKATENRKELARAIVKSIKEYMQEAN